MDIRPNAGHHPTGVEEGDERQAWRNMVEAISQKFSGSGKNSLFMLPAICIQRGTTIVVVPLKSLQTDIKDRCDRCGITSVIWQSGKTIEPASIVIVTPESVLLEGVRDFIRLLWETHRLGWIFIDE